MNKWREIERERKKKKYEHATNFVVGTNELNFLVFLESRGFVTPQKLLLNIECEERQNHCILHPQNAFQQKLCIFENNEVLSTHIFKKTPWACFFCKALIPLFLNEILLNTHRENAKQQQWTCKQKKNINKSIEETVTQATKRNKLKNEQQQNDEKHFTKHRKLLWFSLCIFLFHAEWMYKRNAQNFFLFWFFMSFYPVYTNFIGICLAVDAIYQCY